jgi:hypothetical protein
MGNPSQGTVGVCPDSRSLGFWRARAGLYSPGKRTREETAMRGGGDGDRERRSPYLPSGYYLDALAERDLEILRRPDGSEVTVFSTTGTDPKEIEERSWEDFGGREA